MRAAQRHRRTGHRSRPSRRESINLARALLKTHLRVAAFDDGPFRRRQRYAPLAGVVMSVPGEVEAMELGQVRVDGLDATDALLALWKRPGFGPGARAILLDGISLGGFNIVDLDRLYRRTGRPVVSFTRRRPDYEAMRAAVRRYFPGSYRTRWGRLRAHRLFRVETAAGTRFAAAVGCPPREARRLLSRLTLRGAVPEPLRLAGLLARASRRPARTVKSRAPATRVGPVA